MIKNVTTPGTPLSAYYKALDDGLSEEQAKAAMVEARINSKMSQLQNSDLGFLNG